jgi:LmbE family N-acetylglucosaminyl deacetylase
MKALFLHAHYDDFEFTAGGTFELWRRKLGADFTAKLIVCTDGKAGHHARTREETGKLRLQEQKASAKVGQYLFEPLRLPNGEMPREACLRVTTDLLAALWKAIRDFEPDYLFCPPLAADPLAGVHVDHIAVAQAVREVAYMINVPHAFTPEYPADEKRSKPVKVPVILHTYDTYQFGTNAADLAIDVEEAWPVIVAETWCHQSQVVEWLPWVGRHAMAAPKDIPEWDKILRTRYLRQNHELKIHSHHAFEFFTVSAWGEIPDYEKLLADFPAIKKKHSHLKRLKQRLAGWRK